MASTNRYPSRRLRLPCRQRLGARSRGGKPRQSRCPHCAGASNVTTRNSNRRLGSATSKGEDGAASTITQRYASRLTDSWSPSGKQFPLGAFTRLFKEITIPKLIARGAPPLRPERHIPNSIATIRRRLSAASPKLCRDALLRRAKLSSG